MEKMSARSTGLDGHLSFGSPIRYRSRLTATGKAVPSLTYLGPSTETDHLRDYEHEARLAQHARDRPNRIARRDH